MWRSHPRSGRGSTTLMKRRCVPTPPAPFACGTLTYNRSHQYERIQNESRLVQRKLDQARSTHSQRARETLFVREEGVP